MSVAIVTGSGGLIGAEAVRFLAGQGLDVIGIDNDMRARFFGSEGSSAKAWIEHTQTIKSYTHLEADIRDADAIGRLFGKYGDAIVLVVHTAAQPSHDWAASDPLVDFGINAGGTLNLLENARRCSPRSVFIYCSTNKVYGDTPNHLPLEEQATRWELSADHPYAAFGIDESMSIDSSMHSLFGVSKCSADLMVQEYGRYFGMQTACFRCGCVTGPGHASTSLHGFLSYLVKCAILDQPYTVIGHKGKQVRDNIHSCDLVHAFWQFFRNPRAAAVYNIGGGRFANCSINEAITLIEQQTRHPMRRSYHAVSRPGDHIWWISDNRRFQAHCPSWHLTKTLEATIGEMCDEFASRRRQAG
jgi:CDP-paratose 2-epimerase